MSNVWERQKTDTPKSFEAFIIYRDMGKTRTLAKVAKELGKSAKLIERWSRNHGWVKRVAEYDKEKDKRRTLQKLEQAVEAEDTHRAISILLKNKLAQKINTLRPEEIPISMIPNLFRTIVDIERLSIGMGDAQGLQDEKVDDGFIEAIKGEVKEVWSDE